MGVKILKLNHNPQNTLNEDAFRHIRSMLAEFENDNSKVILITGNDEGYFSNGFQPELFLDQPYEKILSICRLVNETALYFFFFPKPIITAINGHAMGAGAVFSIFSDWRFMADKGARIGFPEIHLGMNFPAFVGKLLCDLVGLNRGRDILYLGKSLKGPEALEIGLVDKIFPVETLLAESQKFAEKLAQSPLAALSGIKRVKTESYRQLFESLKDADSELLAKNMSSRNVQEGLRSILEKRRPKFVD